MNLSDEELVRRCQEGNLEAFGALVERYQKRLIAVAYGLIHDTEEARDLVQESFIRAYKNIQAFRGTSRFYTWIYRITVNLCIDFLRKRGIERTARPLEEGQDLESPPNPLALADRQELRSAVMEAIGALPEEQRAVIILREIEGLSYQEIAQVVESSVGTVMSRLFYARRRLRELLKPYIEGEGHE